MSRPFAVGDVVMLVGHGSARRQTANDLRPRIVAELRDPDYCRLVDPERCAQLWNDLILPDSWLLSVVGSLA